MPIPSHITYCLLVTAFLLASCRSYSDLGNGFKLYEYDREDVYVGYCFSDCDRSSISVIPPTVTALDHNADWIVAKTRSATDEVGYWIVEKHIETVFCYNCGFSDSLRANVRGPLGVAEFDSLLEAEDVALSLGE